MPQIDRVDNTETSPERRLEQPLHRRWAAVGHMSPNVIRFTKRRSRPKGGGGVSAPLPSCTFHGLRGKRAQRAPRDTVCYLTYVRGPILNFKVSE
jgi:hypothetical protein